MGNKGLFQLLAITAVLVGIVLAANAVFEIDPGELEVTEPDRSGEEEKAEEPGEPEDAELGDSRSKGLFYQVHGGTAEMYLFGTVHVGHEEMYPLEETVMEAFREAEVVGFELNMVEKSEMEIAQPLLQEGMFQDGSTLEDAVSEEIYQQTLEVASELGIREFELKYLKPWFVASLINELTMEEAGISFDYGVESYFEEKLESGKHEDKEVIGLEEVEDQVGSYRKLSEQSQEIYLKNSLEELDYAVEEINEMISYWKEGDIEYFAEIREEEKEETPTESLQEYKKALTDHRDVQMAGEIKEILEEGNGDTYFIMVGSLHLVGENSIVDLLEEKGYRIETPLN